MDESVVVKISGSLSPADWKHIREFKRRAAELLERSLIKNGYDLNATVNWTVEQGFSSEIKPLPDEEPFRALLMTFRFFWAQKEPSNFLRVVNVIDRHSNNPMTRQFLEGLRIKWKQSLFGGFMHTHMNGKPLTADYLLDLWFNAQYFHGENEKQVALNNISKALSPQLVQFMLANAVTESCKAVLDLYGSIYQLNVPENT